MVAKERSLKPFPCQAFSLPLFIYHHIKVTKPVFKSPDFRIHLKLTVSRGWSVLKPLVAGVSIATSLIMSYF